MEKYHSSKILFVPKEGSYQHSSGICLNNICIKLKYFLICLILLWLNFPLTATGQTRAGKNREQSAASLLCHEWNINKTANFAHSAFPIDSISSIRFLPNGFILFDRSMQAEAVWNYDDSRSILYILKNGNIWKYAVSALTENELILEVNKNKKRGKISLWRNYNQ